MFFALLLQTSQSGGWLVLDGMYRHIIIQPSVKSSWWKSKDIKTIHSAFLSEG